MAFMQPELTDKGWHWWVETNFGAFVVPGDVETVPAGVDLKHTFEEGELFFDALAGVVRDYVEGGIQSICFKQGYCGRYQAPGYLDATDWCFDTNKRELLANLRATYGD